MRASIISGLALVGSALFASASPVEKRAAITDVQILNYALTLEYLEDSFYSGALAKFDAAAFQAAGFPDWVRGRFSQIAQHEASHVALLSGALGSAATVRCNYSFPYTDPASFAALSKVIENVGVSAYLGAAASITNKQYLTVAGSILTTEARHQAWVSSAVEKTEFASGPYDTPLGFSPVYSIAAAFITSCPSNAVALPVKAFPALTYNGGQVSFTGLGSNQYIALYQGLDVATFPIVNGAVTLPATQGIAYIVATTSKNASAITDDNTLAGPAIISNPFSSKVSNPAPTFSSA